ncbi:hypothetical protein [Hyphomonas sp.]|uniref:hypothetical protein n=1 Tax=Hyphomonas sp. TaxID=87 RepID=UPI00391AD8C5
MHSLWTTLTHDERVIFFNEHALHTKEVFDQSKVELQKVPLTFFQGALLVKALIQPQKVSITGRGVFEIDKTSRSYFIYNPQLARGKEKIIPLSNKSESIAMAKRVLKPKIDSSTVVDYVKFFGLIVEGDEGPFMFIDHEDEIPWAMNISQKEKDKFIGALSARNAHSEIDGTFAVNVSSRKYFMAGEVFKLTIPAIYGGHPFATDMCVTSDGSIRMDEDHHIPFEGLNPTQQTLPFYKVEPTAELSRHLKRRDLLAKVALAPLFAIAAALILLAFCAGIAHLLTIIDVLFGGIWSTFSIWLSNLLSKGGLIAKFVFFGCLLSILFQIIALFGGMWIEHVAKLRPGIAEQALDVWKSRLRSKHTKMHHRVAMIANTTFMNILTAILNWSAVLFLLQHHNLQMLSDAVAGVEYRVRDFVGLAIVEASDWLARGEAAKYLRQTLNAWFNIPNGLTPAGELLKWVAFIVTPVSISANITRLWRWSAPQTTHTE